MEIKEYKESIRIKLYDGEDIISVLDMEKLYQGLNAGVKFIKIDGKIINTNNIKLAEPYMVNSVESFILSQPKDIQNKLKQRERDKKSKIGRGFDSINEIQNYILEHC